MAISGFALGGFAQGFQNQQKINNDFEFNQQRLKLLQQAQQNQQQRELYTRVDKIAADGWGHIEDTVNAFRNAGHSTQEAAAAVTPFLRQLIRLKTSAGMPDAEAIYTAQLSTLLAGPSQAQNIRTLEQAKDPYKSEIQSLTVQEKKANIAQMNSDAALETAARTAGQPNATAASPEQKGDAFLASLPADTRSIVKGLADYDINPNSLSTRTTKGMTRSRRETFVDLASQYAAARGDTYDQTQFNARNKAVSAFSTGKQGDTVRSFNVLVSHLDVLKDAADALNNKDQQAFNRVKNIIASATGNPAPTNFDSVKQIVADELTKAVTGSAGALGDRTEIANNVNSANSPAQLMGVIQQYQHLAAGQLHGLKVQYESSTGRKDFDKRLDKRTIQFFGSDAGTDDTGKDQGRVPVTVRGFTFTPSGQ
jgi:hypothetical protein